MPVVVWVSADTRADLPEGRATAVRIAHLLKTENGSVLESDDIEGGIEEIEPGSVYIHTEEGSLDTDNLEVFRHLSKQHPGHPVHTVLHATDLAKRVRDYIDVLVMQTDGIELYQTRWNPFTNDVYYVQMDGFVGDSDDQS